MDQYLERFYRELRILQKRRYQLSVLKITFVTGFLGFGSYQPGNDAPYFFSLYLAPLVAVLFDILVWANDVAIKRIGAFFTDTYPWTPESKWQEYVNKHASSKLFNSLGHYGFTVVTSIAAIALLLSSNEVSRLTDMCSCRFLIIFVWFGMLLVAWVYAFWMSRRVASEFRKLQEKPKNDGS
jgi:hypothetical protein